MELSQDVVGDRLSAGHAWLAGLASTVGEDTESQLVRLGPSSLPALGELVTREVRVRLGHPLSLEGSIVLALRWEDARRPHLFPVLDGNLEVVALGPAQSRIVLCASYRPPFDGVGRALDQALLHRVAESTVRSFLHKVADALERDDGLEHGSPDGA